MMQISFEPDAVLAVAEQIAGTADFWGDDYREALEVLAPSIASEAGLNPTRAARAAGWLVEMLTVRARIARELATHPSAAAAPSVRRPIFITGLPRTGTTLLHNLMASLPGMRAYAPWEMSHVVHDRGDWRSAAFTKTDQFVRSLAALVPEFATIHPTRADAPDECHWLTRHSIASLIFGYMFYTPTFTRWVIGRPQPRVYTEHRAQLGLLARDHDDGRRLVLKDPGHLWHLDELLKAYPDALVVRLHRDPTEAIPSLCSLMHALHRMDSSRQDPRDVGPLAVEMVGLALTRERAHRAGANRVSFLDLEYKDLVRDPLAAVRRVCERTGHELDSRGVASISAWLEANPKNKAGQHNYSPEKFGLRADEIRERCSETW